MITSTSDCSILIVDDDPDIAFTLQELLEHDGYNVDFVGTGTGALSKTKDRHYNAVILDLGLPDMDGMDVLGSLQRMDPTLPVIILTAFTNSERTIGSLMQGAFHYLTKPYNRDELRATLRRAVGVQALAVKARQVEHALHESEERFRAIVQSASDAIVVADQEGAIVSWNRAERPGESACHCRRWWCKLGNASQRGPGFCGFSEFGPEQLRRESGKKRRRETETLLVPGTDACHGQLKSRRPNRSTCWSSRRIRTTPKSASVGRF